MKNYKEIAQEIANKLNSIYQEEIFSTNHYDNYSEVFNDSYRYEGNDVTITIDNEGIIGTCTAIDEERFESIEDVVGNIDCLFSIE